jgi:DNA-binding MarR family transcriptional regulator
MTNRAAAAVSEIAQRIERSLRDIRSIMNRRLETQYPRGNLTGPQTSVMEAVFQTQGIALKDLCKRVGLAHSTVSGIVDRLQARGMLERKPSDQDRRFTTIAVSPLVREWMASEAPRRATAPLRSALDQASPDEKESILRGLETLQRLLEAAHARAGAQPPPA